MNSKEPPAFASRAAGRPGPGPMRFLLPLAAAASLLAGCAPHRRFDSALWRSPASFERHSTPTIRQQMATDLMGRVLPGRNRRQLEALLGPSLAAPYFRSTGRDLLYLLGPERKSIAIDSEWLLIWLDGRGNFQRARLATD